MCNVNTIRLLCQLLFPSHPSMFNDLSRLGVSKEETKQQTALETWIYFAGALTIETWSTCTTFYLCESQLILENWMYSTNLALSHGMRFFSAHFDLALAFPRPRHSQFAFICVCGDLHRLSFSYYIFNVWTFHFANA